MYADEDALHIDFAFEQPMRDMFWKEGIAPAHTPTDRKVVCKHWLRGLCKKGNNCNFLHIHMTSKMPLCQFFQKYKFCTQADCKYVHLAPDDERARCPWYDRGFCKHGEKCRHRHIKRELCTAFMWGFCPMGKDCPQAHPSFDFPTFMIAGETEPGQKPKFDRPKPSFSHITCHACGQQGHFRDQCPNVPAGGGGGFRGGGGGGRRYGYRDDGGGAPPGAGAWGGPGGAGGGGWGGPPPAWGGPPPFG